MNLNKKSKIFIAGHNGMVGSSILRYFKKKNYKNLITKTRNSLDLLNQKKTYNFFLKEKPEFVIIAAAKVGGILANNLKRGEFIYENLMIQTNLIHSSYLCGVKKLIFLGSSCIYPKFSSQPINEDYLLSGKLEDTNEPYAIAKIAGLKMCEAYNKQYNTNFLCLMPTNLYGPNDNYNPKNSHFFPALLRKIHDAKKNNKKDIRLWGDGTPKRELMFVDDIAEATEFFLKKRTKHSLINIGNGDEKTIKQFCVYLLNKFKLNLKIKFDKSKPNGTPRKILDISRARKYGWKAKYKLDEGFKITYESFLKSEIKNEKK